MKKKVRERALVLWLDAERQYTGLVDSLAEKAFDFPYVRGILEIVKSAGYTGLVIVIDEAETILRMRGDVRGKSLNAIRQIVDAASGYPGQLWVFTGTPTFFDDRQA